MYRFQVTSRVEMPKENVEESKFSEVKVQRSLKKIAVERQMVSVGCESVWKSWGIEKSANMNKGGVLQTNRVDDIM